MSYLLISFESPHNTIKADKALEGLAIRRAVYPIPREISRDCGMGLRVLEADLEQILKIFKEKEILYKNIFPVDAKDRLNLIDRFQKKDQ